MELKKRPKPRSPSFTTPVAVMKTLAGLISLKRNKDKWNSLWSGREKKRGPDEPKSGKGSRHEI